MYGVILFQLSYLLVKYNVSRQNEALILENQTIREATSRLENLVDGINLNSSL